MQFDFVPVKSKSNEAKHGIDFETAQRLWLDPNAVTVPAKNIENETRFARIAQVDGKIWFAVFTYRENNVRLVTVRKARENERCEYEKTDR